LRDPSACPYEKACTADSLTFLSPSNTLDRWRPSSYPYTNLLLVKSDEL
jgi:hypothetical protein